MSMDREQVNVLLGLRDIVAQKRLTISRSPEGPAYRQGFEEALAWVRGTIDDMISSYHGT